MITEIFVLNFSRDFILRRFLKPDSHPDMAAGFRILPGRLQGHRKDFRVSDHGRAGCSLRDIYSVFLSRFTASERKYSERTALSVESGADYRFSVPVGGNFSF
jgi:hypothetical protein